MTDQVQDSVQTQESSGSTENQTNSNDKVSYETYKKVLSEAKKLKEANKLLAEEKAGREEASLKEQNQWKQLYEQANSKLLETDKVLNEQNEAIIRGLKYQTFEKHLGGKLKDDEYRAHVPFDKIIINPETKEIDEGSVKAVAAEFTKKHSHLVEFSQGKLPNAAAKQFENNFSFESLKTKEDIKKAMAQALAKK